MTTTAVAGADHRVQVTAEELGKSEDISKWYTQEINIPPGAQALLEEYSGFAPDEVVPHVRDLVSAIRCEHQYCVTTSLGVETFCLHELMTAGTGLSSVAISMHRTSEIPRPYRGEAPQLS